VLYYIITGLILLRIPQVKSLERFKVAKFKKSRPLLTFPWNCDTVLRGRGSEELRVLSEGKASEDNLKLASGAPRSYS